MARKIAVFNLKGGVAKTTTVNSLAAGLVELKNKVLVIDMDPQSSLTYLLTEKGTRLKGTTEDILFQKKSVDECIMQASMYDYIGSTLRLTMVEMELNGKYNKEFILKKALVKSGIEKNYDYIIFDCPPGLGIFSLNALAASDEIIIPCQCELLAMEGVEVLFDALESPMADLNPELIIRGILPTMLDMRKNISKDVYELLNETYDNVLPPIRTNSKLSELGINKKTIFEVDKNSNGAKDYLKLAEVIDGK